MKQLTCEMCGSTELMKQDGVFVCQTCGTKYSVEEAKKMMIEGTVEVQGTVKVDSHHLISNYLEMAITAYDSDNKSEAEAYCNKIIEIEPTNYRAWLLKGKSAGWQSTLQNPRFSESVSAFAKAITYAPEEEKESITENAKEEICNLASALISLRAKRFAQFPDKNETEGFASDINTILSTIRQFLHQTGAIIPLNELMEPIAKKINESVVGAWKNKILPDYKGDENRPNKYEFQRFIEQLGYCIRLVERAINLSDEDDLADVARYENIIFFHKQAIDACSWDFDFVDGVKTWRQDYSLTDDAKSTRKKKIKECEEKIRKIKKNQVDKAIQIILNSDSPQSSKAKAITATADFYMNQNKSFEATVAFDHVINLLPNELLGYVGKSIAAMSTNGSLSYNELFAPILAAEGKSSSAEYAETTAKYLNYCNPKWKHAQTILMYACEAANLQVVQLLLNMGADIHKKAHNATALWLICHEELTAEKQENGRKIAQILLDKGAEVNIVNDGGIALYNKRTDPEIAKMIRAKHSNLEKGTAQQISLAERSKDPVYMGKMYAIVSLLISFAGPVPFIFGCIALSKPIPTKHKICAISGMIISVITMIWLLSVIISQS